MAIFPKWAICLALALVAGCSLLFEPETCPGPVTQVERLERAEQSGQGTADVASLELPPACGPWLVALSAQISSTAVDDCTDLSSCGRATLSVDGEERSVVEPGPMRELATPWVDTFVVDGARAATELTVELAGAGVSVDTELTHLELVAVPLQPGTPLDTIRLDEQFEVVNQDDAWQEVLRPEVQADGPRLSLVTGCGTDLPDKSHIGFRALEDREPWPPENGPQNARAPVRCAPLFRQLPDGAGIALEAQAGAMDGKRAYAVRGRIQRVGIPPGTKLTQESLSEELQMEEPTQLAVTTLGEGSYLVVATAGLRTGEWQSQSEPEFETTLELESGPALKYASAIIARTNRMTQGFVRRVEGPDTVTLSATLRELQESTTVHAAWSSLLIIPAP